jgi:hypothetical protein
VELTQPSCKGLDCCLQGHHLVERVVSSPESRVTICGIGLLCGATPLQNRRTSRNKEGTTGIHSCVSGVSPLLFLSFTIVSLLAIACMFAYHIR